MKKKLLSFLLLSTMLVGIMPFTTVSAAVEDDLVWPCESTYYITCMYYYKTGEQHSTKYGYKTSMDIAGGGNIVAVEDGVVEVATDLGNTSFGKYVIIKHESGNKSLYAHLASYNVSVGQQVTQGQKIGVMGTTGNSSGVHLHFEYSGGDPWKQFYNAKYMDKISFEQNVRSNNATYNADKTVVNVIDNYYYKSGTNYYFAGNHTHSYTQDGYEEEHPHRMFKECACSARQYLDGEFTSPSCTVCSFKEDGIAINADYVISGCGTGYGQYTADLTDGVYEQKISYNNNWFAFYYNQGATSNVVNAPNGVGSVTIDLGKFYALSQVKIHMINDSGAGIKAPKAVNVYYSVDGENFQKSKSVTDFSTTEKVSYVCSVDLTETAKYVKVEFELDGTYAFLNEIKVFGTETEYKPEEDSDNKEDTSGGDDSGNTSKTQKGDVDIDGSVDTTDYVLVKRSVLKTYTLTEEQKTIADVDGDGDVDATDYVLVKRIVLGTYKPE